MYPPSWPLAPEEEEQGSHKGNDAAPVGTAAVVADAGHEEPQEGAPATPSQTLRRRIFRDRKALLLKHSRNKSLKVYVYPICDHLLFLFTPFTTTRPVCGLIHLGPLGNEEGGGYTQCQCGRKYSETHAGPSPQKIISSELGHRIVFYSNPHVILF